MAHLDRDLTLKYEKEVISIFMFVPDELTFDLDHHQIMAVELTDGSWLPVLCEGGKLFCKVDCINI